MKKHQVLTRSLTLLLGIFVSVLFVSEAAAAPLHQSCPGFPMDVSTEGELNNAIACFNALGGGNVTINVTADITLSGNTTQMNNSSATASLRIEGQNHTIDGDSKGRIFDIQAGRLTIHNLTIQNGVTDANGNGGGMYIGSGANVLAINFNVLNSSATGEGGGVYNAGTFGLTGDIAYNMAGPYGRCPTA